MKGGIFSEEVRDAGESVVFNVDINSFEDNNGRQVSKYLTLDGGVDYIDAGYFEDTGSLMVNGLVISQEDYDILVGMKRDNNHTFLFCFLTETWKVLIEQISGNVNGIKRVANMNLSVIGKYGDMETS